METARAMRARPITHLTLRLGRRDWWTWADFPDSTDSTTHLGLDPAFGDGGSGDNERPVHDRMMHLARERLAGRFPNPYYKDPPPHKYEGTWGEAVSKLPDLQVLELVLETFVEKKQQLDVVAECARTWRFPIEGYPEAELVFDGVEQKKWTSDIGFEQDAMREDSRYQIRSHWGPQGWTWAGSVKLGEPNVEVRVIRFKRVRI